MVIASTNPGKIEEIREILDGLALILLTEADTGSWPEIEETGSTYLENALIKARAVMEITGKAALSDDSGLEVDALGGQPGVRSARFAGPNATDEENNQKLIRLLEGRQPDERRARYRCVAVCAFPDGREVAGIGTCVGRIALRRKGSGGFGYDPWFIPDGEERTMAELSPEEKHAISHRGRALRGLADQLAKLL